MRSKIIVILLSVFLVSCGSSKKKKETLRKEQTTEKTVKSDTTDQKREKVEAIKAEKKIDSKLSFIIIPGKTDTIYTNRKYNFKDKHGNQLSGTLNPFDTLKIGSNTISREKYKILKIKKETLQNRVDSLKVANSKLSEDIKSKTKRSSGNWKLYIGAIIGALITLVILLLIRRLWPRR